MSKLFDYFKTRRWIRLKKWLGYFRLSRLIRWAIYIALGVWVYNNWHESLDPANLQAKYTLPGSTFIPVDGMQVHCRISGKGPTTVLLLHDANSSLHTWNGWTDTLSATCKVISVDLPGYGLTGPHPRGSYSAFMYASFLDSLVARLDLKKFVLAGNGLGAEIAWFYATESPEKLEKLILLDAPGFEEKKTSAITWVAQIPVVNRMFWKITPREFIRIMLEDVYADDRQVNDTLVGRHFELLRYPGNRKAFTDRAQVAENHPPVDEVKKITTPTLILWGAEDTRISPEHAYSFYRSISKSLIRIYRNTGHWPQEENAAQSASDVKAFLEGRF
jgi:pimeloyl-ACP methyl ester carboxylesterase